MPHNVFITGGTGYHGRIRRGAIAARGAASRVGDPGHVCPAILRSGAERIGPVTLRQTLAALVDAVDIRRTPLAPAPPSDHVT